MILNIKQRIEDFFNDKNLSKVLLLPPDSTRLYSGAGVITKILYDLLAKKGVQVHILPALGTHSPMSRKQILDFFGDIPIECFSVHDWRNDVSEIGIIPAEFINRISDGQINKDVPVEINNLLLDSSYDLILSIGQVVPHEVVGMANYSKNVLVGCGGSRFINFSHMLGAIYGIEKILGEIDTPVRKVFDYAQANFLNKLPLEYILTVTKTINGKTSINGLFAGGGRESFLKACILSQKLNITYVKKPIKKCIVFLDEDEFHSTWLGNKAVYRTRKAIADGGELIILAPGVKMFGEDPEINRLIEKYGYVGRNRILELCKTEADLQNNLSAAAHLIHGSSDNRFKIIYAAPLIGKERITAVGYDYINYSEILSKYNLNLLHEGFNAMQDGEEFYFIKNPALGLWDFK